eukprot:958918-Ditylum_brightwellii.AAC.1
MTSLLTSWEMLSNPFWRQQHSHSTQQQQSLCSQPPVCHPCLLQAQFDSKFHQHVTVGPDEGLPINHGPVVSCAEQATSPTIMALKHGPLALSASLSCRKMTT